jgi:hypothetical protein
MDRSSNLFLGGVFVAGMATTYLLRQMKVLGAETKTFNSLWVGDGVGVSKKATHDQCSNDGCDVRTHSSKNSKKLCALGAKGQVWTNAQKWYEECCDCTKRNEKREQEKAKDLAKNLSKEKKDTRMFDPEGNTLVEQFMGFFQTDPQTTMTSNAFSIGQV